MPLVAASKAMALGTKRTCRDCGARFYDFGKPEPACPKCGSFFDVNAVPVLPPLEPEEPEEAESTARTERKGRRGDGDDEADEGDNRGEARERNDEDEGEW